MTKVMSRQDFIEVDAAVIDAAAVGFTVKSVTMRLKLTAGMLIRGQIRRLLDEMKFDLTGRGATMMVNESKGLIDSLFLIQIDGPEPVVLLGRKYFVALKEKMND